jgi:hypothetical protein
VITINDYPKNILTESFDLNDYEDQQEWLAVTDPETPCEPVSQKEVEGQITFDQIIKPENDFHLLPDGYYKFKVVNCKRDYLPETATKPVRPIIRLRLEIENEEGDVAINHIIFINEYNNKEIHSFFSSVGLAEDRDYVTNWDVEGKTGGCYLVQKKLDFKTVNAIDHFISQN